MKRSLFAPKRRLCLALAIVSLLATGSRADDFSINIPQFIRDAAAKLAGKRPHPTPPPAPPLGARVYGTVKWFNDGEGYGFLTSREYGDVFVHWSSIVRDSYPRNLEPGQMVEFTIVKGRKGYEATHVTVVE